jgi:hypothetical protein
LPDICKCGAEIAFLKMESGSPMPYRLDSAQLRLVRFKIRGQVRGKMVQTFEPHWGECPNADEYRKGEGPPGD